MTMGTASTMAAAVDALGLTLPGASSIPAADSAHPRMASAAGRRIVEMVWEDSRPRDILTTAAFENAVTAAMALGGSTNAIIHLIAMAGRAGASLDLDRSTRCRGGRRCSPTSARQASILMEDFYYAGGLRGVARSAARSAAHRLPHRERQEPWRQHRRRVCLERRRDCAARTAGRPEGGVAVLRGNLAPDGAVIKHTAADRRLLQHTGPAVVFRNYNDLEARIDDPRSRRHRRLGAGAAGRRTARRARACPSGACCRFRRSS